MFKSKMLKVGAIAMVAGLLTGCDVPQQREHRGAVIGGAAGAAAGAVLAKEHRVLGAVLGGLLGAGAGYVIGAETDRVRDDDQDAAAAAAAAAQANPATPEAARSAATADINQDGFVTLDEVVAMSQAGFSEQEMIQRLEATRQVFELTPDQEQHLVQQGVSRQLVDRMRTINQHLIDDRQDVIGAKPAF